MTTLEQGFLLLTSHLGNPERKPLTLAQFRTLSQRVRSAVRQTDPRELCSSDLYAIGYGKEDANRILSLLDDTILLERYIDKGEALGCHPMTRISANYPHRLRTKLGSEAPPCLWYKGDCAVLSEPAIGLVGSRALFPMNAYFSQEAGAQAAKQGYTLISGNARGADITAQNACIQAGGHVISIVADTLADKKPSDQILYLSEESFDLPFSALRALSRNRLIHALGQCTLVAQCELETGGSWDGSVKNLRRNWTPLYCMDDGSAASNALQDRGAALIDVNQLQDLKALCQPQPCLFT